jgi:hypothetical protein
VARKTRIRDIDKGDWWKGKSAGSGRRRLVITETDTIGLRGASGIGILFVGLFFLFFFVVIVSAERSFIGAIVSIFALVGAVCLLIYGYVFALSKMILNERLSVVCNFTTHTFELPAIKAIDLHYISPSLFLIMVIRLRDRWLPMIVTAQLGLGSYIRVRDEARRFVAEVNSRAAQLNKTTGE